MNNSGIELEQDKKMMSIIGENGNDEEVEDILAYEFKDTNKEYVDYTRNETDENGNVTVYVSNVNKDGDTPTLLGVDSEEEWSRIKDVLRELSRED